jgi:hypothetical protein
MSQKQWSRKLNSGKALSSFFRFSKIGRRLISNRRPIFLNIERLIFVKTNPVNHLRQSLPLFKAAWGLRVTGGICILFAIFFGNIAWDFPVGGDLFPLFAM